MAKPDPIDRALFREAEDGSVVFFPWGITQRGYRLPDEASRKKAARAFSLLIGVTLVVATWTAHLLQPLVEPEGAEPGEVLPSLVAPALLMVAALAGYAVRVSRLLEGAQESDLRIPRDARLREAAELVKPRELALAGTALALLSVAAVWIAPHAGWLGALGVALGVLLVALSVAARRARSAPPAGPPPSLR